MYFSLCSVLDTYLSFCFCFFLPVPIAAAEKPCLPDNGEGQKDRSQVNVVSYVLGLQAKGQFKKQSVANNVEVRVPVPSDADSPKFKTSTGSAKYVPEKNMVVWTIKSFPVRIMQIQHNQVQIQITVLCFILIVKGYALLVGCWPSLSVFK